MAMVSFAQNGEDVVLARALGDTPRGVYIDIGAGSPIVDSVTRHFYLHGWRGINVEPLAAQYAELCADRPEDVNLMVAVGSRPGRALIHDFGAQWGWSTLSADVARRHADEGLEHSTHEVEVTTLATICEAHVTGDIDFLKVDVEGHEREVLAGADLRRWRPRIIVVEATAPGTGAPTHDDFEDILIAAGYVGAYFDGVNRFYVAEECGDLVPRLAVPPNWFDHAERHAEHELRQALERLTAHVHELGDYAHRLEREIHDRDAHLEEVRAYVEHLHHELDARARRIAELESTAEQPAP